MTAERSPSTLSILKLQPKDFEVRRCLYASRPCEGLTFRSVGVDGAIGMIGTALAVQWSVRLLVDNTLNA